MEITNNRFTRWLAHNIQWNLRYRNPHIDTPDTKELALKIEEHMKKAKDAFEPKTHTARLRSEREIGWGE